MTKKKKKIIKKLRNKYRLVILNDESFEEKISVRLSPLNVFTFIAGSIIFLIVLVIVLIAFTPLREYIPGYTDVSLRQNYINLALKTDSLELAVKQKGNYIKDIKAILNDNPPNQKSNLDSSNNHKNNQPISYKHNKADSNMREYVESEEKYNLLFKPANSKINSIASYTFFTPLEGDITNGFSLKNHHYGVDVVAPKNSVIKSTLDGTVIFANWTSETGYVIEIQHNDNLISVYKHNSVLLKKAGDHVKAGEAIAIIGNSGELTTGPHLHFELWYNGAPLDPTKYMVF